MNKRVDLRKKTLVWSSKLVVVVCVDYVVAMVCFIELPGSAPLFPLKSLPSKSASCSCNDSENDLLDQTGPINLG
ncbi:hypothetical protein LIER_28640 [Lithospermum erythrorhizon]|uniref:Uncharacterized protein n=1 Tax=Lithospermum erythrorhizon TaxID=34254 RepID=A0AAV3RKP0_LITER